MTTVTARRTPRQSQKRKSQRKSDPSNYTKNQMSVDELMLYSVSILIIYLIFMTVWAFLLMGGA